MPLPRMTNIRCSICGKCGMNEPEAERCHRDLNACPNLIKRGMTKAWKRGLDASRRVMGEGEAQ